MRMGNNKQSEQRNYLNNPLYRSCAQVMNSSLIQSTWATADSSLYEIQGLGSSTFPLPLRFGGSFR